MELIFVVSSLALRGYVAVVSTQCTLGWFIAQLLIVLFSPELFNVLAVVFAFSNLFLIASMVFLNEDRRKNLIQSYIIRDQLQHAFKNGSLKLRERLQTYCEEPGNLAQKIHNLFEAELTELLLYSKDGTISSTIGNSEGKSNKAQSFTLIEPILYENEYIGKIRITLSERRDIVEIEKEILSLAATQIAVQFMCRALVEEILYQRSCISSTRSHPWF